MDIMKPISLYLPGEILFLDDDQNFLDSLALKLSNSFSFRLEKDPIRVLQELIEQKPILPDLLEAIDVSDLENPIENSYMIGLKKIREIMFNSERFSHPSVLVVDQFMPKMNGIELCENLAELPVKKILLTGEENNSLAIDAFNNGSIDYFIPKTAPNLIEHLKAAVENLRQNYFQQYSSIVMSAIKTKSTSFINTGSFVTEFSAFLKKYNITEFYLLDMTGSYIGLNSTGDSFYFLVKHKKQIEEMLDIVESSDDEKKVSNDIIRRNNLVYFFNEKQEDAPISAWSDFSYPINKQVDEYYLAIGQHDTPINI